MRNLILGSVLALTFCFATAHAAETVKEKAAATADATKQGMKKGMHRVEEAVCTEGDVKCAAKKAANRAKEGGDSVKGKAKEMKNNVDND